MRTHALGSGARRDVCLFLAALLLGVALLGFARPARAVESAQGEWTAVGGTLQVFSSGIRPSLAISGGTPFVAYNVGGGFVAKYTGGAWSTLPEVRPGNYPSDMTLKIYNGTLYAGYLDAVFDHDYGYATVTKYNGTYWPRMGDVASAGDAMYMSMDLYNGTPYVACTDKHNLVVKKLSGSVWANVGATGIVYAGDAEKTVLKVDAATGTPYVACADQTGRAILVYKFSAGAWTAVGDPISALIVPHLTMAVNGGRIYVGTYDNVYTSDGAAWQELGNPGTLVNSSSHFDLALHQGVPYYVFTDGQNENRITLKKHTGSAWENMGPAASPGSAPTLAFDGSVPYIAFVNHEGVQVQKLVSVGSQPDVAIGTVVNCTTSVNVRSGPGTSYAVIGSAPKGAKYTVLGQSGSWYKIDFNGQTGYISTGYLSVSSTPTPMPTLTPTPTPSATPTPTATPTPAQTGTVVNCTTSVNVRSGPGTSYAVIGSAPKGAKYAVLGQSGSWYKIDFNGKTGYISTGYLSVSSTPTPTPTQTPSPTPTTAPTPTPEPTPTGEPTPTAEPTPTPETTPTTEPTPTPEPTPTAEPTPTPTPTAPQIGTVVNCTSSVNVRSGPGTNYATIGSARKGATYTVTGQSGSWYKIDFNGKTGYISTGYLSVSSTPTPPQMGTVVNCTTGVNVRSGPRTSYAVIGSAPKGAKYAVTGQSGSWYKIDFNGKTGYISTSYLSVSNA